MKKTTKKLLSLLMSIILIFAIGIYAFAADGGDGAVAKISVCSRDKEVPSFGHTWIYVENI